MTEKASLVKFCGETRFVGKIGGGLQAIIGSSTNGKLEEQKMKPFIAKRTRPLSVDTFIVFEGWRRIEPKDHMDRNEMEVQ